MTEQFVRIAACHPPARPTTTFGNHQHDAVLALAWLSLPAAA